MSYTFIEPTIFYELAFDTAVLARARGLKNNFVTNGFISEAPLRELSTVLDAANIDPSSSKRRLIVASTAPACSRSSTPFSSIMSLVFGSR